MLRPVRTVAPTAEENTTMTRHRDRPLGLRDIAELFGVGPETPDRWRYRPPKHGPGFPDPDGVLSGRVPYWWETTIERWGRATGRWPGDDVAEARLGREEARQAALREAEAAETQAAALRAKAAAMAADAARAEATATEARARAERAATPAA